MNVVKLTLKLNYLTVSIKTGDKVTYDRTIPSQYYNANLVIKAILKVLCDKYTDICVHYEDCVKGITHKINTHESAPPEDKYRGLPASTRYIPDKMITFEAKGKRYKIDAKGNIYIEDNSEYFKIIKRSKLRYLFNEFNAKRISDEEFLRKTNQVISKYR